MDIRSGEKLYTIPERFRRTENLHIVFWLLKDLCWVMLWKPLGVAMIVPTVGAALLITWQTRHIKSELLHNLAVVFWILANIYWMITEFFFAGDSLRYYAAIPFLCGIAVILYHYSGTVFRHWKIGVRKNRLTDVFQPQLRRDRTVPLIFLDTESGLEWLAVLGK